MKKLLFIYNPRAGKGTYTSKLTEIIRTFIDHDYQVEIYPSAERGDATRRAGKACGQDDLIVCAGGDGTLNEVVTGVYKGQEVPKIGYLPVGSTNDFAASLMLPLDPVEAAEAVMNGSETRVDVGELNGRPFVYVAAFGAFTQVAYGTDQTLKNIFGHAAYLLAGIKALTEIKSYPLTVQAGGERIEGDFIYGMITNSLSVGGFKNIIGRDVALSDGLFEVTLIRYPDSVAKLQEIVTSLLTGNVTTDLIISLKTEEILVSANEPMPWTIDGEYGGDHLEARIRNNKQSLTMLLPKGSLPEEDA